MLIILKDAAMTDSRLSQMADCLVELAIESSIIADFCTSTTDEIVGRECVDTDDKSDLDWWRTHNKQLVLLFQEAAKRLTL